jgi:hypothetical protein
MTLYIQPHRSQYEAGASAITRRAGCTWTAGANGAAATTGGRQKPSPDAIHERLQHSEESSPLTPGWSITDLATAMSRYKVPLHNKTGAGFNAALADLNARHYIVLQGDSDQFGNDTCSGAFDGDHAIGVHPEHKMAAGVRWWWINDPICKTGRWERESVLRRYAEKLDAHVRYGSFVGTVPEIAYHVRVRPGVVWFYTRHSDDTFTRQRKVTGGFSADCTAPKDYRYAGTTKTLVMAVTGFAKGVYLDRNSWNVTVTKE